MTISIGMLVTGGVCLFLLGAVVGTCLIAVVSAGRSWQDDCV